MFEGYLEMGGNEVINSARALGYSQTAPCQINWLICPPCDGIADVRGDGVYNVDTISTAPWYDKEDEPTRRFYGVHGIKVEGVEDSTRTADVIEGITDGGVVGQLRYASKRIRVQAMLTAKGKDALAAGFAWLDAVLRPDACGVHGTACGATDVGFFVDCPPTRGSIIAPIGTLLWKRAAENLEPHPTPHPEDLVGMTGDIVTEPEGPHLHAVVVEAPAQYVDLTTPQTAVDATFGRVTFQAEVRLGDGVAAAVLRLLWRDTEGNYIPSVTQDSVPVTAHDGWAKIVVTGPTPYQAASVGVFLLLSSDSPVGATVDVRRVMAQRGGNVMPFFDGDTPATGDMQRYAWTGDPNNSISIEELAEEEMSPSEIIWRRYVDQLERSMHNVTCISGPTIEETLNRGEAWGYIVEFVLLAATPWVFSNPVPVTVPPGIPDVIQDTPFNLVPYPSAELAGANVLVATNYVTNPSVETSITGWTKESGGVVAGDVTVGLSTAISAAGDQSVLAHFVASNSGTDGAITVINFDTTFPAIVAGQRMSVSMWAFPQKVSGTAVLGTVQILANWRAGSTDIREDVIGTVPAAGGFAAKNGIAPPVGVTGVQIRARLTLTSWSTGAVVDLYADACAVTIP